MTRRRVPWFTWPIGILVLGIIVAGLALYAILESRQTQDGVNSNINSASSARCGNGVCENVACLAANCPAPETAESCPADCASGRSDGEVPPDDRNVNQNQNLNQNTNAVPSAALDFTLGSQSNSDAVACPVSGANMTPSDVASSVAAIGMQQGTSDIRIVFGMSESPLDQCIWTVRNYVSETSGTEIVFDRRDPGRPTDNHMERIIWM